MEVITRPAKEAVRHWLADRRVAGAPPPTPEQIRRELSWGMTADKQSSTR